MTPLRMFGFDLRVAFVALLLSLVAFTGSAAALPVLDFDFSTGAAGPGGSIVTSGGNVVGTGILIDMMTFTYEFAIPTSQTYDLSGAGAGLSGPSAILNFSTGGAGGNFIEIIGGAPTLGVADGSTIGSFSGGGPGLISNDLLTALGLPNDLNFDIFGFTMGITIPGQGGPYIARSTDIVSTVPNPSILVMLGMGLLTATAIIRRVTS
jgi:hypothetical protein